MFGPCVFGRRVFGRRMFGRHGSVMQQKLGHIKADAARADDRDAPARLAPAREQVGVDDDLRMADALDVRHARTHAGGDDHMVELLLRQMLSARLVLQTQLDAALLDAVAEVAQQFVELFLARHGAREVELPADARRRFKQRDRMTALRGGDGAGQAGRTGADHGNTPLRAAAANLRELELTAGARVHQAGGGAIRKNVVQARLVARDAGVDVLRPTRSGLAHEVGVGEEGPRHRHHVGVAARQDLLRDFRHVDAVRRDHRNRHRTLHARRGEAPRSARHDVGDRRDARLVPADAGVDDVGAGGFDRAREFHDFTRRSATFHEVERRDAVHQEELRPEPGTRAAHDLHGETMPVLHAATELVGAVVRARHGKLIDQVAFRAHHLHAVEARALREFGAAHIVFDRLPDLGGGECARHAWVDARGDR